MLVDLAAQTHAPLVKWMEGQKIDATNSSFWLARNGNTRDGGPALGLMERQRLKLWLGHVHGEFATLAL